MPQSIAQEALSESVPTAFAPFDLDVADYAIEWAGGAAPAGVELRLMPGSLQWVRVMDVLPLPRARLEVVASGAQGGRVSNAKFHQALAPGGGAATAQLPVALISGEENPIEVSVLRDGREIPGRALLRFKPRASLGEQRVFYDANCSRYGMSAEGPAQSSRGRGWAVVGCRFVELEGKEHMASALEAFVFWDGVGQSVKVGGAGTPSTLTSLWPLRLRSEPGSVPLAAARGPEDQFTLRYSMPKVYHRGALGLGIGPYLHDFEGSGEDITTPAPMLTLYGSYFVTEAMRLTAFGAATFDRPLTTDLGFYLNTTSLRVLDNRLVSNLLLGVHANGFRFRGKYHVIPGVPQGAELLFLDAFKKGHTFMLGAFLYPLIDGKAYYNAWVRWGSSRFFGELNYISWAEKVSLDGGGEEQIRSRSVGVSVGFPIPGARFL